MLPSCRLQASAGLLPYGAEGPLTAQPSAFVESQVLTREITTTLSHTRDSTRLLVTRTLLHSTKPSLGSSVPGPVPDHCKHHFTEEIVRLPLTRLAVGSHANTTTL